ncbi:unnamed protein product [marine sediment metagenome]|uniref:Uncharacterized protein n=1 Tax=marine sediment metagenome TaxID=412755 RepID=X0RHV3_9ZZZZ
MSNTEQLLQNAYKKKEQITELEQQVINLKDELRIVNDKIFKTCSHEWIRDSWANFDDICKYYCKKCLLWKDGSSYT